MGEHGLVRPGLPLGPGRVPDWGSPTWARPQPGTALSSRPWNAGESGGTAGGTGGGRVMYQSPPRKPAAALGSGLEVTRH